MDAPRGEVPGKSYASGGSYSRGLGCLLCGQPSEYGPAAAVEDLPKPTPAQSPRNPKRASFCHRATIGALAKTGTLAFSHEGVLLVRFSPHSSKIT